MLISSTERIEAKVLFAIGGTIAIIIGIFFLVLSFIEPFYFFALIISIGTIWVGTFSIRYSMKLSRVELFTNYIQISRNKKIIQVSFKNIKSVNYLLFPHHWFTESAIKLKFREKTPFGKSIFLSPSNLTKENNFVFNQKIKRLLEDKIEESRIDQTY